MAAFSFSNASWSWTECACCSGVSRATRWSAAPVILVAVDVKLYGNMALKIFPVWISQVISKMAQLTTAFILVGYLQGFFSNTTIYHLQISIIFSYGSPKRHWRSSKFFFFRAYVITVSRPLVKTARRSVFQRLLVSLAALSSQFRLRGECFRIHEARMKGIILPRLEISFLLLRWMGPSKSKSRLSVRLSPFVSKIVFCTSISSD